MTDKIIIAAMTRDRVIGKDGDLPWHIPEDMALFKRVTMGNTVLMGRKTYESIPEKYRPLPGRDNVVLSRSMEDEDGVTVARSIDEAVQIAERDFSGDLFIMGGASVYEQMLCRAELMRISWIDEDYEGDTYFPEVDWNDWGELDRDEYEDFTHVVYERIGW